MLYKANITKVLICTIIAIGSWSCMEDEVINLDEINTDVHMNYAISVPVGNGGAILVDLLDKVDSAMVEMSLAETLQYDENNNIIIKKELPEVSETSSYIPKWVETEINFPPIDLNAFQYINTQTVSVPLFTATRVYESFYKEILFHVVIRDENGNPDWPAGFTLDIEFPVTKNNVFPYAVNNVNSNRTITLNDCWISTENNIMTLTINAASFLPAGYTCHFDIPELNPFYIEGSSPDTLASIRYSESIQILEKTDALFDYVLGMTGPILLPKFENPIGANITAHGSIEFIDDETGVVVDSIITDTVIIPKATVNKDANGNPVSYNSGNSDYSADIFDFTDESVDTDVPFNSIRVRYSLDVIVDENENIFIFTDDADQKIKICTDIDLPINLQVAKARLTDTLDFNLSDIITDDELGVVRNIDSLNINFTISNSIPLGFNSQLYLLDSQNNRIDSIFQNPTLLIRPSILDGRFVPETSESKITFEGSKYDTWNSVSKLLLILDGKTSDYENNTYVSFNKNDSIAFEISLDVKGSVIQESDEL